GTQVPAGASGSSAISANDFVPPGASLHSSAGERSSPLQVNSFAISPPFEKSELLSVILIVDSPFVPLAAEARVAIDMPFRPRCSAQNKADNIRIAMKPR